MERGLPLVVFCLLMLISDCFSSRKYLYNDNRAAFFVFGDSLFDPGNNNYINTSMRYHADFWPYGESYFNPPSGRFGNGRIIPDFIAEFASLPLIPAYLNSSLGTNDFVYGANFASGGAGTLNETNLGLVISLKTQLDYFSELKMRLRKNLGDLKTEQLLSDAVYLFSTGGNDYDYVPPHQLEQYMKLVIGNLTDVFKGIYEKGGRKFAVVNLPEPGCFPILRVSQPGYICNQERNFIARQHNQQVSNKLKELEKRLEGFMYSVLDFNTEINKRLNNPTKYGFKIGDTACCGGGRFRGIYSCGGVRDLGEFTLCDNVNDYLFFDATHTIEIACHQFAELFWKGDTSVAAPYNLKTLFQVRNSDHFSSV